MLPQNVQFFIGDRFFKDMIAVPSKLHINSLHRFDATNCLWPRCVADEDIIFLPCSLFFFFLSFSSSTNPSRQRLDVYHTSTHGVALV